MKQIYNFEQYHPPALNERMLRARMEQRRLRRQMAVIALAGALVSIVLMMLAFLAMEEMPVFAIGCFVYVILSAAGGGALAIIYSQKGGIMYAY